MPFPMSNETMTGPALAPAPPDQQPRSVGEILSELDATLWADREITPDEQREVLGFFQMMQMKIQAAQAGGQVGPGPLQPDIQQPPPGPDDMGAESDYSVDQGGDSAQPMSYMR